MALHWTKATQQTKARINKNKIPRFRRRAKMPLEQVNVDRKTLSISSYTHLLLVFVMW